MTKPRVLGAVLAGGRSRRFGADKALARLEGRSLLERAVAALTPEVDGVVVVGRDAGSVPIGADMIPDLHPGHGPLGGLETALHVARHRHMDGVFLMGCDLPLVTPAEVRMVLGWWRGRQHVVAPVGHGGAEPLLAVYGIEALPVVEHRIREGRRAMRGLLDALGAELRPLSDAAAERLLNVNTPVDLQRAEGVVEEEVR